MLYFLNNLYIRIILASFFALFASTASSQSANESQNIEVTFNKTSSIVFPAVITSVDRGSRDVLAQKAKGVSNVLQLKAGRVNFKETNLTVITGDGKLHHFFVRYADRPSEFIIQATEPGMKADKTGSIQVLFPAEITDTDMGEYARNIIASQKKKRLKGISQYDMKLSLQGIYIRENIMFYHLKITNKSNIPFHTDMLRFYVKDKRKVKRTASQEVVQTPLYHYGDVNEISGKSSQDLVYALPKFTIPDAKVFAIELMEQKGGRHLRLAIKNKTIIKALPVPAE